MRDIVDCYMEASGGDKRAIGQEIVRNLYIPDNSEKTVDIICRCLAKAGGINFKYRNRKNIIYMDNNQSWYWEAVLSILKNSLEHVGCKHRCYDKFILRKNDDGTESMESPKCKAAEGKTKSPPVNIHIGDPIQFLHFRGTKRAISNMTSSGNHNLICYCDECKNIEDNKYQPFNVPEYIDGFPHCSICRKNGKLIRVNVTKMVVEYSPATATDEEDGEANNRYFDDICCNEAMTSPINQMISEDLMLKFEKAKLKEGTQLYKIFRIIVFGDDLPCMLCDLSDKRTTSCQISQNEFDISLCRNFRRKIAFALGISTNAVGIYLKQIRDLWVEWKYRPIWGFEVNELLWRGAFDLEVRQINNILNKLPEEAEIDEWRNNFRENS